MSKFLSGTRSFFYKIHLEEQTSKNSQEFPGKPEKRERNGKGITL